MSSALLKKALSLCESDQKKKTSKHKGKTRVTKLDKKQIIQGNRKITVAEAREQLKAREKILTDNLQMIKEARKASTVKIPRELSEQIVQRAIPRKNRKHKETEEVNEETLFTEEDFKKFEEEYVVQ